MKIHNQAVKFALFAGCVFGASAVASAATIDPGPGEYNFVGPAMLTSPFAIVPNLSCTLRLTGNVQKDGNGGVVVTVTDGDATDGFGCGLVGFEFPWTANVPASDIPADPTQSVGVMFENVVVTAAGRNCSDQPTTVPAIFSNGNPISQPSSFMFNSDIGDCAVTGTINAQNDVNVTQ